MTLKDKMGPKGVTVVKVFLWAALLSWMVFFGLFSVIIAQKVAGVMTTLSEFWEPTFAAIMIWVAPIWVVFTAALIIIIVARWANRKLRSK